MTKHIFVTGGVVSSLGKGIAAAGLAAVIAVAGGFILATPWIGGFAGGSVRLGKVFRFIDTKIVDGVLVNGKRYHPGALVNVNGSQGRSSSPVDLNSIPVAAIERVERGHVEIGDVMRPMAAPHRLPQPNQRPTGAMAARSTSWRARPQRRLRP